MYFVKRARRILYEGLLEGPGGECDITLHGEKGRNALSLGTINIEASKLDV